MRFVLLLTCVVLGSAQLGNWDDYSLIWEDQFDTLDLGKWQHEVTMWGGGNSEFQTYTPDSANSYTSGGVLYIKPTLFRDSINPLTGQPFTDDFRNNGDTVDLVAMYGACTMSDNSGCVRSGDAIPPIMSGRLRSFERFSFTYGRVRCRARMPTGDWMWPAIWLLPELYTYGGWPMSGEIDIIEIKSNEDFVYADGSYIGYQHMGSTLHWGPDWTENRYYLTTGASVNDTVPYGAGFHMLEMDWSEAGFRFLVDDVEFLNIPDPLIPSNPGWTGFWDFGAPYPPQFQNPGWESPMAPFDQAFHFVLNVAVGGTNYFFPDDGINRGGDPQYTKPWSNTQWHNDAFNAFYAREADWYWTWTKESPNDSLQIDFLEVYQLNA